MCVIKFMNMETNEEDNLKITHGYVKFKQEIHGFNEKIEK